MQGGVNLLGKPKGIITALVTPFDEGGSLDEKGLVRLIKRQLDNLVHGLAVVAGSGEYVNLSEAERSRVVEISVSEASGQVPVIAGILSPNTHDAVSWAKEATRLGADALLLLSPYYNKPSSEGIVAHFRSVAEATELPVIVYNNPGRTGIDLIPTYEQLAEIPNIVGVKECNRDLAVLSHTIASLGDKWSVLSGEDDLLYPSLALGSPGAILTTSNIVPSHWVAMYDAFLEGDHDTAKKIHFEVLPLIETVYTLNHPALVKKALALLKLPAGSTRAPLADPTASQIASIQGQIDRLKLSTQG
jgi:4-hydroxy-tetrahydrodipicolinate synthase